MIGGVTATGSIIAFGKLAGSLDSAPMALSMRDQINMAMGAATFGCMGLLIANPSPSAAVAALIGMSGLSGVLGAHMTASIGGADMPVVITVLNSYSGWALCAEGFMLDKPLLTTVGALIGSSGAILTHIMVALREPNSHASDPRALAPGVDSEAARRLTAARLSLAVRGDEP